MVACKAFVVRCRRFWFRQLQSEKAAWQDQGSVKRSGGRRGEVWEGREFEKSAQYCCWRRISKDSILPSKPAWADTAENLLRDIHNMNQYVSTRKTDNNCSVQLLIIYSLSSILQLQLWFPLGKFLFERGWPPFVGDNSVKKKQSHFLETSPKTSLSPSNSFNLSS